jgi:hypothetical protein
MMVSPNGFLSVHPVITFLISGLLYKIQGVWYPPSPDGYGGQVRYRVQGANRVQELKKIGAGRPWIVQVELMDYRSIKWEHGYRVKS